MSEEPFLRVETTTTRTGVNYEAAVMSALIAQDMAGGPRPGPDPELLAWKMSGGRERGPLASGPLASGLLARLLPEHGAEAEAGS